MREPGHRGRGAAVRRGQGTALRAAAAWPAELWRVLPLAAVTASPMLVYLLVRHPRTATHAIVAAAVGLVAVLRPRAAPVILIAVTVGAAFAGDPSAAIGVIAVMALAIGFRMVTGALPLRRSHLWIAAMGGLIVLSYTLPATTAAAGITDQRYRSAEVYGILAGLALLAVSVTCAPKPRSLARAIAVTGAAVGLYVLVGGQYTDGRLQGLTLNANYLGALLALPFVTAVGLARASRSLVWVLPAIPCLAGIVATESRGAFLASAAGLVVVSIKDRPLRFRARALLPAGIATAIVTFGGLENLTAGDRAASDLARSREIRQRAAEFAMRAAAEHPVRGVGYGMFPRYAADSPGFGVYVAVHNDYLRLAAEAGVMTLGVFLLLLFMALRVLGGGELMVLRAVLVAYATSLFFANTLSNLAVSAPFWTALGCLLARSTARRGDEGRGHIGFAPLIEGKARHAGQHCGDK